MIDLNHVRVFVKVVESGSFAAASRALGIPTTSVSRKVSCLETALGARLLNRSTRKIELTSIGSAYLKEAALGLARLDDAGKEIENLREFPSGVVRLTAPVELGARFLTPWIAQFMAQFEQVKVELILRDRYIDLIAERIDIAIRIGRVANASFIARKLCAVRRVLVASPSYVRSRGSPRTIEEIREHDCVLFGATLEDSVWHVDGPNGSVEVAVKARMAVDNMQAAINAVAAGVGVGLLPAAIIAEDVRTGRLLPVLPGYTVEGSLFAIYPSRSHQPLASRALLDFVACRIEMIGRLGHFDWQPGVNSPSVSKHPDVSNAA